jgi:hypothetical protein
MFSGGHPNTPSQELINSQYEHAIRYLIRCERAGFDAEEIKDGDILK